MLIIDDRYEVYNDNLEIDKFYKVKDIETNSYVFLKKLEQNKNIKDSFIPNLIDESTMILNLDSKYIANILDVISYESTYYVISEYFDGISLLDLVNNKDLKTNDIISISKQIISAMKLCDESGLYHGAFRLDNVFIDKDYNIKIYDLGITKANGGVNIRMNNNIAFLCPHQLNVNYTDKESDFFAIGIIMYYCLFKKMPFKIGVNDREMLKNIDKGIDLNKDRTTALSKGLVDIIKKLLARKNKYSSYSEILIDFTKIMYVNADIVETKNTEYDEGIYIQHKKSNSFMIKLISIIMCAVVLVIVIAQL